MTLVKPETIAAALPEWYYVTVLSNFARGYDKYQRRYTKDNIPESAFADKFFVLRADEVSIGIAKAEKLLKKLGLEGDGIIALKTHAPESSMRRDHASGLGQYMPQNHIDVDSVYHVDPVTHDLTPARIEDIMARSFTAIGHKLSSWEDLTPRSVSVLPIALACQASCKFCFSKASVSSDFQGRISDWDRISEVLKEAKKRGAERAVITGGGEPTLLKKDDLLRLVQTCAQEFNKVVLINNGQRIAALPPDQRQKMIKDLDQAGLSVLAISRHHYDPAVNKSIMGIDTHTEDLLSALREEKRDIKNLKPRFVCVLQKGGIDSVQSIENYVSWAVRQGVHEVNFKELYVSTTDESCYSDRAANDYSARNQVSLKLVFEVATKNNWQQVAALPWGAPVFRGQINGQNVQVAAYTEPSVYWERTHGTARSWNLMADGTVLASLEDPKSVVMPR